MPVDADEIPADPATATESSDDVDPSPPLPAPRQPTPAAAGGGDSPLVPAGAGASGTYPSSESIQHAADRITISQRRLFRAGWKKVGQIYRCETCAFLATEGRHQNGSVKGRIHRSKPF